MSQGKPHFKFREQTKKDPTPPYKGVWRGDQTPKAPTQACAIKEECGTCTYINQDYEKSLATKYSEAKAMFQAAGILERCRLLPYRPSPLPLFYRTHAKVAVRPSTMPGQRFKIGLFKRGTHDVINMDYCPLHKDTITKALKDIRKLLEASDLQPYNESNHSGDIRYIAIRASHLTDEIMITFVCLTDVSKTLKNLFQELKSLGHHISSGYMNLQTEQSNNIFGDDSRRLIGADRIRENVCDLQFEIGPTSFFQVNPWQAENIYRRVEQLSGSMPRGAIAWDLYCGTGTLSMVLARNGYRVLGIEENPQATRDAEANVRRNDLSVAPHFIPGRVEDLIDHIPNWAESPALIVANPSRRGMAEGAIRTVGLALQQKENSMFIYVSCEAETLIRDVERLRAFGLELRQLEVFDMFPFTNKLEWIAVIVRSSN